MDMRLITAAFLAIAGATVPATAQMADQGGAPMQGGAAASEQGGAGSQQAATPFLRDVAARGQPEYLRNVAERYNLPGAGGSLNAAGGRGATGSSTLNPYAPYTYSGNGVLQLGAPGRGGGE
jgi:hypothetical protein